MLTLVQPAACTSVTSIPTLSEQTARSQGHDLPSTCPAKIINYITHSLPQQCLSTSWTGPSQTFHDRVGTNTAASHLSANNPEGATSKHSSQPADSHAFQTTAATLDVGQATGGREPSDVTQNAEDEKEAAASKRISEPSSEADIESPLDNANFLSFEDWKKQNLAKAGQSAEGLGAKAIGDAEQRRRPAAINNALDSLGEDAEIDFDFGGFVSQGPMQNAPPLKGTNVNEQGAPYQAGASQEQISKDDGSSRRRPKDAGRTCKERTNYASYDCAATTLKSNAECKSPSAILVENKDTYMLNICSAQNKFFIVELCDNILIDTIVLANFEFFSSMFRTFRVSVSDRYPVKLDKWRELGTYEAKNSRQVQAFLIENPLIWARYVRVEMLSHFGKEYYCPVSLFRVHGTTMMEEFNSELKGFSGDDDPETETGEEVEKAEHAPEVITIQIQEDQVDHSLAPTTKTPSPTTAETNSSPSRVAPSPTDRLKTHASVMKDFSLYNVSNRGHLENLFHSQNGSEQTCFPKDAPRITVQPSVSTAANATQDEIPSSSKPEITASTKISPRLQTSNETSITQPERVAEPISSSAVSSHTDNLSVSPSSTQSSKAGGSVSSSSIKGHSSSTQPPTPTPSTQESFFKSVHKRLQLLEANSTLSLQYIEEQSRILRDAFAVVEKRQTAKTTNFLEALNATVVTELVGFRKQYDQIWQSTVLELSSQREKSEHEVSALSARVSLLADEIVFQRRMAILQFMLILFCLGLVIFSRNGSSSSALEFRPFVQNAFSKSSANFSKYAPLFDTPPSSPSASRPPSRYGILRSFSRQGSPNQSSNSKSNQRNWSPSIEYTPPTPESHLFENSDSDDRSTKPARAVHSGNSPPEPDETVRPRSTPATPELMKEERRQFLAETDALNERHGSQVVNRL